MDYSISDFSSEELNARHIFLSINQLHAWWWLLGFCPKLGEKFCLPPDFRIDNHPGCHLHERSGKVLLSDWASDLNRIDIIAATQHKFKLSYPDALHRLYTGFLIPSQKVPEYPKDDFEFHLGIQSRTSPINADLKYWDKFCISINSLEAEDVLLAQRVNFNTRSSPDRIISLNAQDNPWYAEVQQNRMKVHMPGNDLRFLSSLRASDIGGRQECLSPIFFMQKAFNDYKCIANQGYSCRYLHCETVTPPVSWIKSLEKEFDLIPIMMDNDKAGIEAGKRLEEYCRKVTGSDKFRAVWTRSAKNASDVVALCGQEALRSELRNIL